MADIIDGLFDFSFLMGFSRVGGPGENTEWAEEVKEGVIEADEWSFTLGNGGQHIIYHHFPRRAVHEAQGVEQSPVERFLSLGVGELKINKTAVGFDKGKAIKLSLGVAIGDGAEVAPIDLALPARGRFKADEGAFMESLWPDAPEIILDDGVTARKTVIHNTLMNEGGGKLLILIE